MLTDKKLKDIINSRKNGENKYTNKCIQKMINRRITILSDVNKPIIYWDNEILAADDIRYFNEIYLLYRILLTPHFY